MTEPLIDRNELTRVISRTFRERGPNVTALATANAVTAHLRAVLTPEALGTYAPPNTAAAMLRRIFGEDR